jgi:hypothetical protein
MRTDPAWHSEAITMHEGGARQVDIAARCGVSQKTISKFLCRTDPGYDGVEDVAAYDSLVEPHKRRVIREVIKRKEVMPAARLFAAGLIDREELMRRITPAKAKESKPSNVVPPKPKKVTPSENEINEERDAA